MDTSYYISRLEKLTTRINALKPRIERAHQAVRRLETEQVPAGATAAARAAQLSAARLMANTLEDRSRQLRIAAAAIRAELDNGS
ncbi:hypothetical protein [Candidatus Oscillochloris fontis]|uniref:hypothetical protein n=1 Tax=Candidatus Oscillochloris fontis TaxID=2496868 RepID=UPI00101D11DB|nr:hypothetical protein [Candidatus Oscillochloris fontis]